MSDNSILQKIKTAVSAAKSIAIVCHIRPDGDTIGSALAFYRYIELSGKKCVVYCDDILPDKYSFLYGFDKISSGELDAEHDIFVCVDCSDIKRIGKYGGAVARHANTVNIDHHISNEKFAAINYLTESSSTCEIIYTMLKAFNAPADKDIYTCIYCGLSSDTGNFAHSNTTYKTFEIAAEITSVIGDISGIVKKIFKQMPIAKFRLLGEVFNSLEMFADGKIAIFTVYKKDLEAFNCLPHDTEGFVDYAVNISGVDIGAILLQSENNSFKISLRSNITDVCKIAAEFGGGGHKHASGCMLFGQRDEVVKMLVKNAEFYM